MPSMTWALSAICGTHFGETKLVDSMALKPVAESRLISSILTSVGTIIDSFCSPSRGPTSTIFTRFGTLMAVAAQLLP